MSLFGKSIDYSNNPIMTELLDSIAKGNVSSYAITQEFLMTDLKIYADDNCDGAKTMYSSRGYKPLTFEQVMDLSKQMLKAAKRLPNVKKVWENPNAKYHRISTRNEYGKIDITRVYIYKAYFIEFKETAKDDGLKDW